jgi:hypothetical protein
LLGLEDSWALARDGSFSGSNLCVCTKPARLGTNVGAAQGRSCDPLRGHFRLEASITLALSQAPRALKSHDTFRFQAQVAVAIIPNLWFVFVSYRSRYAGVEKAAPAQVSRFCEDLRRNKWLCRALTCSCRNCVDRSFQAHSEESLND